MAWALLLGSFGAPAPGQRQDPEELRELLTATSGEQRLPLLLALLRQSRDQPVSEVAAQAEEALLLLDSSPDRRTRAEVLNHLSWNLSSRGEPEAALERARQAHDIARAIDDRDQLAQAEYHLALASWYLSRVDAALEHGRRALSLRQELGDPAPLSTAHTLLGAIHRSRSDYDEALRQYVRARELSTQIGDGAGIARGNNNIGLIHWNLGNHEQAKCTFDWRSNTIGRPAWPTGRPRR